MRLLRSPGMPALVEPYDKDSLSGGAVYLAPPDYHMMIDGTAISLSTDPPEHHARPSINVLFSSVARRYGTDAVGVILSGASDDGAAGAQALHRSGGKVLVQDPDTADASTLPLATLSCIPDARVLSIAGIVEDLNEMLKPKRDADE